MLNELCFCKSFENKLIVANPLNVDFYVFILLFFKSSVCLQCQLTVCRFAMGGIFTTELYAENWTFNYHKTVWGARNPVYSKSAVCATNGKLLCKNS